MKTIRLLTIKSLLIAVLCTGFYSCQTGEVNGVPSHLEELAREKFLQEYINYYPNCYIDNKLSYTKTYIGESDKYTVSVSGTNPETGAYINIIYNYEKDGDEYRCTASTKF